MCTACRDTWSVTTRAQTYASSSVPSVARHSSSSTTWRNISGYTAERNLLSVQTATSDSATPDLTAVTWPPRSAGWQDQRPTPMSESTTWSQQSPIPSLSFPREPSLLLSTCWLPWLKDHSQEFHICISIRKEACHSLLHLQPLYHTHIPWFVTAHPWIHSSLFKGRQTVFLLITALAHPMEVLLRYLQTSIPTLSFFPCTSPQSRTVL